MRLDTDAAPVFPALRCDCSTTKTFDCSSVILTTDTVPVTRENALAHAAVVRSVLDRKRRPCHFASAHSSPSSSSEVTITLASRRLQTKLAHVRGCVEMSVKIIWQCPQTQSEPQMKRRRKRPALHFSRKSDVRLLGRRGPTPQQAQNYQPGCANKLAT